MCLGVVSPPRIEEVLSIVENARLGLVARAKYPRADALGLERGEEAGSNSVKLACIRSLRRHNPSSSTHRCEMGQEGSLEKSAVTRDKLRKVGFRLALCGIASISVFSSSAPADIRLPRLIGDHMVLQRDCKLKIWGWADPGERVSVAFNRVKATAVADRLGRWSVPLGPFKAGGPSRMEISGRNKIDVADVLVGDVWVAAGQSNMEFPLKHDDKEDFGGTVNSDHELADTSYPEIRLFKVDHAAHFQPADEVKSHGWEVSSHDTAGSFSAVAYLFGREIHRRYRVPVGIIETSWGGTVAEAWMSPEGLRAFPEFSQEIQTIEGADEASALAAHQAYVKLTAAWDERHLTEDRGTRDGRPIWADPSYDASTWPIASEPQDKPIAALNGFDGIVWYRRELSIPPNMIAQGLRVNLAASGKTDTTYFNGVEVGHTEGWKKSRSYPIPVEIIKPGKNVIAIRMTGEHGYVGIYESSPGELNVSLGRASLTLAGAWAYQPGPAVADRPVQSAISEHFDDPNTPTALFNGMVNPLLPYGIKGVIWYQGEENAEDKRAAQYRTLFPGLINDWRSHWHKSFAFLFVQLAGFGENESEPAEYQWAELREAQSLALKLPKTGMATAVDIGDENDIHPKNKQDVAHRLALVAEKVAYGEPVVASGPTYDSMQVKGDHARIKFGNLGSGLVVKDRYGNARGFEIAGADGKFHWAQARQEGNDIVVSASTVPDPVAVRYDWENTPDGNLYNKEGLPAIPFRTDVPLIGAK